MVKKNITRRITLVAIIIMLIIASYYSMEKYHDNYQKTEVASNINNEQIDALEQVTATKNKIEELQANYHNEDIKAILSIENINQFSYPVAQTTNNEYYLNHNYYGEDDSLGAIYTDYRVELDSSSKILIYGHSSTKRDVPFNQLENYYDEDYYQNHKYINLATKTNIYRYEIFSVYVETNDFTYMNMNFDDDEEWYRHLLKLKSKSFHQNDIELSRDDEILIMQTCSNHPDYQKYSKKYLLIVSRRVKE